MNPTGRPPLLERLGKLASSPLGGFLKLAAGLLILGVVISSLDRAALGALLVKVTVLDGALVLASAIAAHALGAWRFKQIADPTVRLTLRAHLGQYFTAAYFNLFLPSSVGGDGVRIWFLTRGGISTIEATSLVVSERVLGLVSLFVVAGIVSLGAPLPLWIRQVVPLGALAAVSTILLVGWLGSRLSGRRPWLASVGGIVHSALGPRGLTRTLGASLVYQVATVGTTILVGRAADLPVPALTILALTPLVWLVTVLPISVGGLGVREAAFVAVFRFAGVSAESAAVLSLGTYAGLVAVGLIGGVFFTWQRTRGVVDVWRGGDKMDKAPGR